MGTSPEAFYICSGCSQGYNLRGSLAEVDELVKRLEGGGYSKELDDAMEALPGCHSNFHIRIRTYIAFLDQEWQAESALLVATRASIVIETIKLLDPGCTKILGRMLAILTAAQRVLLKEQMKKEELYNEEREEEVEERNGKENYLLYMRTATKLAMNMAQA